MLSSTAVGLLLGLAGHVGAMHATGATSAALRIGVLCIALLYAAAELRGYRLWYPQRHWLVPRDWGLRGRIPYAAGFGAILGAGVLTYIPFVGYWFLIGLALKSADPTAGALIMSAYGGGRITTVIVPAVWGWLTRRGYVASSILIGRLHQALSSSPMSAVRALTLLIMGSLLATL